MPELILADPDATEALGRRLAAAVMAHPASSVCIYLHGELGAGKTSLARGFLRGCGHTGRVPSPTYTLVEPYSCSGRPIYHLDLYRLADAAEFEFLGVDDLVAPASVLLIEWPGQGGDRVARPDLELFLEIAGNGRCCRMVARSAGGQQVLDDLDRVPG